MTSSGARNFVAITGPAGSGKSAALISRIAAAIEAGATPADIRVLSAGPNDAAQLERRIAEVAPGIRVTTPLEAAVAILDDREARSATARVPRILSSAETAMLLMDLEMLGGDRKRNREIVKFLLREWTELPEDKETFIVTSEEQNLHDGLKERLQLRRGMLAHEAADIAVHYLRHFPAARGQWQTPYVFADDVQNMSLASQMLLEELAGDVLVVAGDDAQRVEVMDPYPYPNAMATFMARHTEDGLEAVQLPARGFSEQAAGCLNAFLSACEHLGALRFAGEADGRGTVEVLTDETPAAEYRRLGELTAALSAEERKDTLILVSNPHIAREVRRALASHGVPSVFADAKSLGKGNLEDPSANGLQRAATLVDLLANAEDVCAWRAWIGYGEHLYNGIAWHALETFCGKTGIFATDALRLAAAGRPMPDVDEESRVCLGEAYLAGRRALEGLKAVAPKEFLAALAETVEEPLRRIEEAFGPLPEGASMKEIYIDLARRVRFGVLEGEGVTIATPAAVAGIRFERVFLPVALDGFYPGEVALDRKETVDHRAHALDADERVFLVALTRFLGRLTILYPETDTFEAVKKTKMGFSRIFASGGIRMVRLAASRFVTPMLPLVTRTTESR